MHNRRVLWQEGRVNRILLQRNELRYDGTFAPEDARAQHILKVLHGTLGQSVKLGIVDGPKGVGVVGQVDGARVVMACTWDPAPPPRPRVDLLLALPRPKVMRRLWAPLASLGVGTIIITNAAKVERNYFDASALDEATWTPLLLEGLTQASDTLLPRVHVRRRLRPLVEDELAQLSDAHIRLVADPAGPARLIETRVAPSERILLAVGPEGGWTPFEVELLQTRGFSMVSVGTRILRTDTACLALLGILSEIAAA